MATAAWREWNVETKETRSSFISRMERRDGTGGGCKSANGKTVIVPRSHSPAFPSLRRRMGKRCRCCRNVVPNYNFSVEGHQPERFSEGPPYFNKGTTGPRSAARFKPEEHPRSKLLKYSEQEEEKEQQLK